MRTLSEEDVKAIAAETMRQQALEERQALNQASQKYIAQRYKDEHAPRVGYVNPN